MRRRISNRDLGSVLEEIEGRKEIKEEGERERDNPSSIGRIGFDRKAIGKRKEKGWKCCLATQIFFSDCCLFFSPTCA